MPRKGFYKTKRRILKLPNAAQDGSKKLPGSQSGKGRGRMAGPKRRILVPRRK